MRLLDPPMDIMSFVASPWLCTLPLGFRWGLQLSLASPLCALLCFSFPLLYSKRIEQDHP